MRGAVLINPHALCSTVHTEFAKLRRFGAFDRKVSGQLAPDNQAVFEFIHVISRLVASDSLLPRKHLCSNLWKIELTRFGEQHIERAQNCVTSQSSPDETKHPDCDADRHVAQRCPKLITF